MSKLSVVFAFGSLVVSGVLNPQPAWAERPADCPSTETSKRCVLWKIVHDCLEPSSPNYCSTCSTPLTGTPCTVKDECLRTDIWDQDADFISIKDTYKSCGCAKDFVHGLVIPRATATGIEDPRAATDSNLIGAWEFAWKVALKKIGDTNAVLLVANPFSLRSQDQLHIHIVRLASGVRDKLLSLRTGGSKSMEIVTNVRAIAEKVSTLRDVWSAAQKAAKRGGFKEYGVAVIRDKEKYLVVAVDSSRREEISPERGLALYECPEKRAIK